MEQDYQALVAAGPLVEALANGVTQRDVLRGKMHRLSPLLDSLLGTWHDYAGARREELLIQHEQYRAEQDGLQNEQRGGTQELMRLEREIAGIQRWLGELSVLKTRFALVDDAKVLEQQLLAAKDAHDELAGALAHSRQFSSEDLEERLRDLEKRLKNVRQRLEHADNSSYARLREEFSQRDVERLMRLFNGALFSLPLGENRVNLDDGDVWVKSVEAILDHFKGEHFEAPGLSIDLSHIRPPALQALADPRRPALTRRAPGEGAEAAQDPAERRRRPRREQGPGREAVPGRAGCAEGPGRLPPHPDADRRGPRLAELAQLEASQDRLKRSSDAFAERVQQLSARLQLVARQLGDLEAKAHLEDALRRRQLLPADLPFGTPFMEPVDDSLDNLLPLLSDYQDTWQALQRIDGQIEALYARRCA